MQMKNILLGETKSTLMILTLWELVLWLLAIKISYFQVCLNLNREGWWCLRILILHSHMCILHPSFFFFWKYQVTLFPTLVLPLCVNYSRDDTSFSRDNNNFTFFMTTFRPPPHESWCHKTSSPSSFFCMSWLKVRIQSKTWCFVFQNVFFLIFIFNHYSGDTIPKAI